MSFSDQLKMFHNRTMTKYNKVRGMAALDIFSSIIISTPVAKGPLRNNWFVSIAYPSYEVNEHDDGGSDQEKINEIVAKVENYNDPFEDILFVNNLPYAAPIEYDGHSAQAPEGMVRINTARWDHVVRLAAKKVKYGV